jgi:hypothetical protein
MAERETIALAEEVAWRERAMWLLVRALGGKVSISDEQWAQVPERPELVIDRSGGVMRWTAREHEAAPADDAGTDVPLPFGEGPVS